MNEFTFPPRPEEPLPSDCCGNGCHPCVLDIYQEELAMWETECAGIRNGHSSHLDKEDDDPTGMEKLLKDQYTDFTIESITKETHNTIRVRFGLHKSQSLGLSVGQHVIIRALSSNGSPVTRQYTPISPVQTKGYFEFIFKIYPSGVMSNILKCWQVGDSIDMRGPVGSLLYVPNKYRRVVMLCAGTGIAPMAQVIHAILDNEHDETLIRLVYACKSYNEILTETELDEWRRYWNFSAIFVLSQEPESRDYYYRYGEEIIPGRIDSALLKCQLGNSHLDKTLVLICGTTSFDSDMLKYVKDLQVPENNTHKF